MAVEVIIDHWNPGRKRHRFETFCYGPKSCKSYKAGATRKVTANINKKSPTGTRNYALFATLLDTGLRASEAAGITLTNLNLADGYIKVMGKGSKERMGRTQSTGALCRTSAIWGSEG